MGQASPPPVRTMLLPLLLLLLATLGSTMSPAW
jgi:hypothetical protein